MILSLSLLFNDAVYSVNDRTINDCGVVGGMRIGRKNRCTRGKPSSVSYSPPQIVHDMT